MNDAKLLSDISKVLYERFGLLIPTDDEFYSPDLIFSIYEFYDELVEADNALGVEITSFGKSDVLSQLSEDPLKAKALELLREQYRWITSLLGTHVQVYLDEDEKIKYAGAHSIPAYFV